MNFGDIIVKNSTSNAVRNNVVNFKWPFSYFSVKSQIENAIETGIGVT